MTVGAVTPCRHCGSLVVTATGGGVKQYCDWNCKAAARRNRLAGRPESATRPRARSVSARILAQVAVSDGCWEWAGHIGKNGYGQCGIGGSGVAHRKVYEALIGTIPDGLTLDHLCRNRGCVNPSHLEPVSMRENVLRGESFSAISARKTHCPRGHELAGDNLYPPYLLRGKRSCWKCRREHYGKNRVYATAAPKAPAEEVAPA